MFAFRVLEEVGEGVIGGVLVVVVGVVEVEDACVCIGVGGSGVLLDPAGEEHGIELFLPVLLVQ
jgi:hypothetical protein